MEIPLIPALGLISAGLLIFYFRKRNPLILWTLAGTWLFFGGFIAVALYPYNRYRPLELHTEDLVGTYQVDTLFYPGKNARWQHKHFQFSITKTDSVILVCKNDEGIPTKILHYHMHKTSSNPPYWHVQADTVHHLLQNKPTLYRGKKSFYYVLKSPKYGNIFFRKMKQ